MRAVFILALMFSNQVMAATFECKLDNKCLGVDACDSADLELEFTVADQKEPEVLSDDPLRTPSNHKPVFVRVDGLGEEFKAFPIWSESDDLFGFFGHLRINERILDQGYFWGAWGDQHLFTLHKGIARYSIHKPLKNIAIYLQGEC